jgi:DNA-damage-inducible protein J
MRKATLNTRIDADLKDEAEAVFRTLRITRSEAVRLFYRQVALRRGLPFDLCVPNDVTVAALDELDADGGRRHRGTSKQIVDAILHERE